MKSLDTFFQLENKRVEIETKMHKGFSSQRAELLETIITKINQEREGTKWKPVTPVQIAVKLKGIPTGALVGFVKTCQQSRSFGECFFGKLKKR